MIIPFFYDLYEYDRCSPKLLSIFYKYVGFCLKNDFPIIAQEKFFYKPSEYKKINHWGTTKDAEKLHTFKVPTDDEIEGLKKYIIKQKEDKKILNKYNDLYDAADKMMHQIDNNLVNIIESFVSSILKQNRIEAFLVWLWNPSLEYVANKYSIPIIQMELSPIRKHNYREHCGYFKFTNKYDNSNIEKLYDEFDKKREFLDRKELLALLLNDDQLYKLNLLDYKPKYEIGYALGLKDDLFEKNYSNVEKEEVLRKINSCYNKEEVLIRNHPANIFNDNDNYNFDIDNSKNSDEFILKCKRIICNISNIGYEANLYGKTVINISKSIPTAFSKIDTNYKKEEIMSIEKLNFLTFYEYVSTDLMFDIEYIKWRLTNPSVNEIYDYNLNYLLNKYNIKEVFKLKKEHRFKYVLEKSRSLTKDKKDLYLSKKNLNINKYKLIFSKTLARKIINKLKFSNKLGTKYLGSMETYYRDIYSNDEISKILFSPDKIAVNICCDIEKNKLVSFLDKILFPFDLYSNYKNINSIYLDNIFIGNIFSDVSNIGRYKYIINIYDDSELELFKYGFIESCLSLLMNNQAQFINIGNKNIEINNYKKTKYRQFINDNISVDDLFDNKSIAIKGIVFINTDVYNDLIDISEINDVKLKLLLRYAYLKSNKRLKFINYFEEDNYKEIKYEYKFDELEEVLNDYETISFDIFDTLVTRRILNPDDLFRIIEKKCDFELPKSFLEIRKEAEMEAIKEYKRDVNIDDIYIKMKEINNFKDEHIYKLKKLECDLEYEFIIPRKDMIKMYNNLLKNKKNIDIISDMYLPKEFVIKILNKCGIKKYRKLYLSNDINKRKDTGEMWDYYFKNNKEKTIHVGDNYKSDYIEVLKRGKNALRILKGTDMFNNYYNVDSYDVCDSQTYGILYNENIFNSPFFNDGIINDNLKKYGEYFLAPIFKCFFDWFIKNNTSEELLFISREGYYLQKIYKHYCKLNNINELSNNYFLISRRAISYPCCNNIDDVIDLTNFEFHGTIKDFFQKRFSIEIDIENNSRIILPDDAEMVIPYIRDNSDLILKNAKKEREEYFKYIKNNFSNEFKRNVSIIDLGYSGTTQFYLSKFLNKKIEGYYFAVTKNLKPLKLGCKAIGCFNQYGNDVDDNNLFYKKSLLLESFLSAPHGQLINFIDCKPNFTNDKFNKERKKALDQIYEGIKIGLKNFNNVNFSINSINEHYKFICEYLKVCNGKLENVFYLDDDFCTDGKNIRKLL